MTVTTASFVLNGSKSGTRVSDETRRALEEAAKRIGYRPNNLARSLVRQKCGVIAMYSSYDEINARNYFFAEIMGGLQVGCGKAGVDLLIHTSSPGSDNEAIAASLLDGRADGVIVHAAANHQLPHIIAKSGVPAVAIADRVDFIPSVVVDDEEGGALQARHLFERGHRRVLYRPAFGDFLSAVEREGAFFREAERLGVEVILGDVAPSRHRAEFSERECDLLLSEERPSAIVCWEDATADRTISVLEGMGLKTPRDLAVMGFNGISVEFAHRRWLTTIDAHWANVAEAAIGVLIHQIEGKDVPPVTTLPVHFVQGATT